MNSSLTSSLTDDKHRENKIWCRDALSFKGLEKLFMCLQGSHDRTEKGCFFKSDIDSVKRMSFLNGYKILFSKEKVSIILNRER